MGTGEQRLTLILQPLKLERMSVKVSKVTMVVKEKEYGRTFYHDIDSVWAKGT